MVLVPSGGDLQGTLWAELNFQCLRVELSLKIVLDLFRGKVSSTLKLIVAFSLPPVEIEVLGERMIKKKIQQRKK